MKFPWRSFIHTLVEERHLNRIGAQTLKRQKVPAQLPISPTRQVLVETGDWMYSNYLALSAFTQSAFCTEDYRLVGYSIPGFGHRQAKGKRFLKDFLLNRSAVPHALGIDEWIDELQFEQFGVLEKSKAQQLLLEVSSLEDLERLVVDGIWIGDLLYDDFLAVTGLPTIDLDSKVFKEYFAYFVHLLDFWTEYFSTNEVEAVLVSHSCYRLGVPARVAAQHGVEAFSVNIHGLFRIDKERFTTNLQFIDYPERFRLMSGGEQQVARDRARLRIERRLHGEVGVDMPYASASAFGSPSDEPLLRESQNLRVLILTHCFFDNPHPFGLNFYPDVLEWLTALGRISEETGYDWYIKTHPDPRKETAEVIENLVTRFPRLSLLPNTALHNQLVSEGVDVVLTIWGTAGWEYPYMGVPALMASASHPFMRYNFAITPESRQEFEQILHDLPSYLSTWSVSKDELHEFYYMHYLERPRSWLIKDYSSWEKSVGGYQGNFTPRVYRQWAKLRHENEDLLPISQLSTFKHDKSRYYVTQEAL